MERTNCVLCRSNLIDMYTFPKYPITPSSSLSDMDNDVFKDITFSKCVSCSSVQLKTLIDPVVLYENAHNSTESTPTWKLHHALFTEFILNRNTEPILEIGGSSGVLYESMRDKVPYSMLDICDNSSRPLDIPFIQANCESFHYKGYPCVVLSHTFEHLYNPVAFIENLRNSNVSSVFISIPNMTHLLASNNISVLHTEHTFFIESGQLISIFSEFSYTCKAIYHFKAHSIFYHFVLEDTPIIERVPFESDTIQSIFLKYETLFKTIVIDKPCFICPAGHYGQKIYYYLKRYAPFIKGFIDNDVSKQNMRVYGTPSMVYSPDILKTYQGNICVLLYAGPYTDELREQLTSLHSSIEFIDIFQSTYSEFPSDISGKGVA